MHLRLIRWILAGVLVLTTSGTALAQGETTSSYVVLFTGNGVPKNAASTVAKAGGELVQTLPQIGMGVATSGRADFAERLARNRGVLAVAQDQLIQWIPADIRAHVLEEDLPSAGPAGHDPAAAFFFPFQWNMRAIKADDAWAAGHQGNPSVTVAILDTGIDPTHIDMSSAVDPARSASFVTNTGIVDPDIGIPCDDPDLIGTFFPGEPDWIDLHFHGTHVGGIVAAQGFGVSGVAPHVNLMAVKVLNVCGFGFFSWIIQGIVHAADNGADVINMSLGARFPRSCMIEGERRADLRNECAALLSALNRATNYAHRKGTLVISSAGNGATNADKDKDTVIVPAQSSNVVGVSATGPLFQQDFDQLAFYSDFGVSLVSLAAPGGNAILDDEGNLITPAVDLVLSPCSRFSLVIPACQFGNFFLFAAGTSMAAPHASGVAALIDSESDGRLNASQLQTRLQQSADDLGKPGADPFYGHGRVNAFNGVE